MTSAATLLLRLTPEEVERRLTTLNGRPLFHREDLSGVSFAGKNLSWMDFWYCDLRGADFTDAILRNTDFHGSNLIGATGITYYDGSQELLREIAAIVTERPDALDMDYWHGPEGDDWQDACDTAHCIGGWAVALRRDTELEPGLTGHDLEELYGTQVAALMLLGPEAHSHFYDTYENARIYLQQALRPQPAQASCG